MSIAGDARVLAALLRGQPRDGDHAARLDAFYAPQAAAYDGFRERLLHGRRELMLELAARVAPGGTLVELGGGTGRNLGFLGAQLADSDAVTLVDLCRPLLAQARQRAAHWPNVRIVEADACDWQPSAPVDAVVCAYALSMIPDWYRAIDNAVAMLAPGGLLAVADFYVSRARPAPGHVRHSTFARHFWPLWFGHDGVHPSPDHLPCLESKLDTVLLREARAPLPWLPGLRAPYYVWIGRRRGAG